MELLIFCGSFMYWIRVAPAVQPESGDNPGIGPVGAPIAPGSQKKEEKEIKQEVKVQLDADLSGGNKKSSKEAPLFVPTRLFSGSGQQPGSSLPQPFSVPQPLFMQEVSWVSEERGTNKHLKMQARLKQRFKVVWSRHRRPHLQHQRPLRRAALGKGR